jgi:hypothetical protein
MRKTNLHRNHSQHYSPHADLRLETPSGRPPLQTMIYGFKSSAPLDGCIIEVGADMSMSLEDCV